MSLPLPLSPGTVIGGHYHIQARINSGGFGAVYRGIDTSEGNRLCAIKETYDATPPARRQALMEASVLFTIRSEHLPAVYDAFENNGRFYLVMQLVEGQDLLHVLKTRIGNALVGEQGPREVTHGPFSEQEILDWLLPVMEVLEELHGRKPAVIHRDIKPGNIILTPNRCAVLVDFGLTKLYDPNRDTQSMVKAVSKGFSPVEQYLGKTTPQSDIYAMAATMYLLLTNCLPPDALARSARDTLIAPRELNPALSPRIERALLTALAVQPDQRYATMHDFVQALRAPVFTGHAEATIAVAPVPVPAVQSQRPPAPKAATPAPKAPPPPVPAVQPHPNSPGFPKSYSPGMPATAYPIPAPAAAPARKAKHGPAAAPQRGRALAPRRARVPQRSLPSSANQGCLWGMVQGVFGGVLVLLMRQEATYYIVVLMGFVLYLLAGFLTTRRGGLSLRGGWAGLWAGLYSTIIFWSVVIIGMVVLVVQRMLADRAASPSGALPSDEIVRVWRATFPKIPHYTFVATQPDWINTLISLLVSIALAFALGWIGGALGRYRQEHASW